MIRYVVTFPPDVNITPRDREWISDLIKKSANAREWMDIVISHGATIKDVRIDRTPSVRIRNIQKRLR